MQRAIMFVAALVAGCATSEDSFGPRPENWPIDVYLGRAPAWVGVPLVFSKPTFAIPDGAIQIGNFETHIPLDPAVTWGACRRCGEHDCSWPSMLERAKKRARDLGGDAIVVGHWSTIEDDSGYATPLDGDLTITIIRYDL